VTEAERGGKREHRRGYIGRGLDHGAMEGGGRTGPGERGQPTEAAERTSGGVGAGGGLSGVADAKVVEQHGAEVGQRGDVVWTGAIEQFVTAFSRQQSQNCRVNLHAYVFDLSQLGFARRGNHHIIYCTAPTSPITHERLPSFPSVTSIGPTGMSLFPQINLHILTGYLVE
jgi:hypothetical protein